MWHCKKYHTVFVLLLTVTEKEILEKMLNNKNSIRTASKKDLKKLGRKKNFHNAMCGLFENFIYSHNSVRLESFMKKNFLY